MMLRKKHEFLTRKLVFSEVKTSIPCDEGIHTWHVEKPIMVRYSLLWKLIRPYFRDVKAKEILDSLYFGIDKKIHVVSGGVYSARGQHSSMVTKLLPLSNISKVTYCDT